MYGEDSAGGLIGVENKSSWIEYCASYASVTRGTNGVMGKMVGIVYQSYIRASYNAGVGEKHNAWVSSVSNDTIPHDEAAWEMNQAAEAKYYGEYYWKHTENGVAVITTAADATTQKFILNPGHAGDVTKTLYGKPDMTLPAPNPRTDGYTFYMWQGSGGEYYDAGSALPPGSHSLIALWLSDATRTVTVGTPENGTVSLYFPDKPEVVYAEGAVIENVKDGTPAILKYTADEGYGLEYMTVNGAGAEGLCATVDKDMTVSASITICAYKATGTAYKSVTLENASVGIVKGLSRSTIRFSKLYLMGDVSFSAADTFYQITFDNATVNVTQLLESDSYIIKGQSSCVFTGFIQNGQNGRLRSERNALSAAFPASEGSLTLSGGGSWVPALGDCVLRFNAPSAAETFPERLICDFGSHLTLQKVVDSGAEYYKLSHHTLSLTEESGQLTLIPSAAEDPGDVVLWAEYDENGRLLSCQSAAMEDPHPLPTEGHTAKAFWLDADYKPRAAAAMYPLPSDS